KYPGTAGSPSPSMISRILIISENFTGGGVETQIANQVSTLKASGIDTFIATGPTQDAELRQLPVTLSVPDLPLGSGATIDETVGVADKLCQIVEQHGIDLIHCHPFYSALVGILVAQRTHRPLVYTLHGPASLDLSRGSLYRHLLIEILLPSCGAVFCVSRETAIIARSLADGHVVPLPNPVQMGHAPTLKVDSRNWAWAGRLDEQKAVGLMDLIAKAKCLIPIDLHIYGDGPARADVESFAGCHQDD